MRSPIEQPTESRAPGRRVVVTGMGVVSPIGVGCLELTEGLRSGRSGIRLIRGFDSEKFPNRLGAEIDETALLPYLDALPATDRDWLVSDRKLLFGAIAATLAMAEAGASLTDGIEPHACGVSFGVGEGVDLVRAMQPRAGEAISLGAAHWSIRDERQLATRVPFDAGTLWAARRFGFEGPNLTNSGACAAGAMAIGEAFRLIKRGKATVMLAGGFDAMINPLGVMGFSILGALSSRHAEPDRASRPFDQGRDGFVPGEGAGVLVIEELAHAQARGARIHGEILGYGASLDAYRPTAPEPEARGAQLAIRGAIAEAGWSPADVEYINAHGTSTPLNDLTETKAIKAVLGEHAYRIPVSSTKSQIGHLVAGAGAVELVATLLAANAGFVPPTLNLEHPDPECDLDYVPGSSRPQPFTTFLSNSFAFGGQNACIAATRFSQEAPR